MAVKVGINGFGRIGRLVARAIIERNDKNIELVAINDLVDSKTNAHLTRHDTVHGRFDGEVKVDGDHMVVNGDRIRVFAERDPAKLPWGDIGVEYVLECTGLFTSKAKAGAHLKGEGAAALVLDCIGFTEYHRAALAPLEMPVILSNAVVARAVSELFA